MDRVSGYQTNGTATAANGDVDKTLIAAVSGKTIYIKKGVISVTVAATGGGGVTGLEDGTGGGKIISFPASAVGTFAFDFGDLGYPITQGNLLNLTVDSAGSNQATATAAVVVQVI